MKATKTYKEIVQIDHFISSIAQAIPTDKEYKAKKQAQSFLKKLTKKVYEEANELRKELYLNNALTGKSGEILFDDKGNQLFSIEGQKKIKEALKDFDKKEVEVHYDFVLSFKELWECMPKEIRNASPDLDDDEKELLSPFYTFDNDELGTD